jgi:hypothetical protein
VADEQRTTPRRTRRARDDDPARETGAQHTGPRRNGQADAAEAARKAAQHVADFTGKQPECVTSIERHDGDWQVGVEVVETHRIPDTTDVLAIYEVRLDADGNLLSYRRKRRYARGQLDRECR